MQLRPSAGCGRPHEQRVAIDRGGESLPRPEAGAFGDIQIGGHTRDEQRRTEVRIEWRENLLGEVLVRDIG